MGSKKVFAGIFLLSFAFGKVIEWKESTLELRVPPKSVVGLEFPCKVKSVFVNDLVQADYNENTVFVSVGTVPTSVGVSCEKDKVYRGYSIYFFPTSTGSGDVFFKIRDEKLEKLVLSKEKNLDTSKEELLTLSRYVLRSILRGEVPQGFSKSDYSYEYSVGDFIVKIDTVYVGSSLIALVGEVRPKGYMQKKLTEDILFDKGTTTVWLEKTGWISHSDHIKTIIIKTRGTPQDTELKEMIPHK